MAVTHLEYHSHISVVIFLKEKSAQLNVPYSADLIVTIPFFPLPPLLQSDRMNCQSTSDTDRVDDSAFTKLHFVYSDDREWFLLFDLQQGEPDVTSYYPSSCISYETLPTNGREKARKWGLSACCLRDDVWLCILFSISSTTRKKKKKTAYKFFK